MSNDDQSSLPVPVSIGQIVPSNIGAIYLGLDQLLGTLRRKNHSVLDKAFALSNNRLAQNIIWRLSEHGSLTAKELSLKTGSSPSTVSNVVADLVRLGVIVKQSGPRGTEPLSISNACKLQIKQHIDYVKYLLEDSFCALDTNELSNFIDYIKRITSRLDKIEEFLADQPGYYFTETEEKHNHSASGGKSSTADHSDDGTHTNRKRDQDNITVTLVEKQTSILERIIKLTLKG
jgi:DNA-binding MarR family transcriptional regulator